MATQPLETIPEETPAPTPAPVRVTADPPKTKPATEKNPGRVASGKRLAERNRLAREAKKRQKQRPQVLLHRPVAQVVLQLLGRPTPQLGPTASHS